MNNVKFFIKTIFNLYRPIIKNTVLFRSFYGQYNDNPKYISEELHKRAPDVNIYWAIRDGNKEDFPSYVKLVELDGDEYIRLISRAEAVVDNYTGARTSFVESNNIVKRIIFRLASKKKRGQLNISTWHGTPLKRISLDEPKYQKAKFARAYTSCDLLMSGCNITSNAMLTAISLDKDKLFEVGTPRNDILFKDEGERLKQRLGLPKDKRVALFAPTFRDSVELSGLSQLKNLDIERLLAVLSQKFGGEWCFVFRSHNLVMKKIQAECVDICNGIINGNEFPDMAEYLSCTDLLITDYSGSMFDFLLTKRPCVLYAPDLDNYKNSERGFYFDITETPFPIAVTADELYENVKAFDIEKYQDGVDRFLVKIENAENGRASEKAVDKILDHLRGKK